MQLWLSGRCWQDADWEFNGVFSTYEKAVDACTAENDFVVAIELDARGPEERIPWADFTCPKQVSITEWPRLPIPI